jgi:hypothetical protein
MSTFSQTRDCQFSAFCFALPTPYEIELHSTIALKDGNGATALSSIVNIGTGSDRNCENTSVLDDGNGNSYTATSVASAASYVSLLYFGYFQPIGFP